MGSRRSERVDDRVHRRPRRRAQKDEGDCGDGRVADEDEHDRQSGEQRRVPTDAKRRGPRAEPGDDRAHDRVHGRRGREEQSDLRGADAVLAQLQRDEKVDRASHEADEHDDRDPREHELVGPSEPEHVGKTLLRRLGPRKRRRNEEGRGDECGRDGENEKRCSRVVAVGEDTRQYGAGREAESRNCRGERERSGASLVRERVREPRGTRAPERAEGDPEGRARCEQRPELAREPLAERCEREQARRGDRHPAGSEAVGEDAQWQRDDECCEARSREQHPRLHARERELVRERRSERDHRDPDEGLQQEERVDRQDGAAHGPTQDHPTANSYRRVSVESQDDGLRLRERLEHGASADPSDAGARARSAAERQVALPVVGRLVDVHPACVDRLCEAQAAGEVARPDSGEKAVWRRVGDLRAPPRRSRCGRSERRGRRSPRVRSPSRRSRPASTVGCQ